MIVSDEELFEHIKKLDAALKPVSIKFIYLAFRIFYLKK